MNTRRYDPYITGFGKTKEEMPFFIAEGLTTHPMGDGNHRLGQCATREMLLPCRKNEGEEKKDKKENGQRWERKELNKR